MCLIPNRFHGVASEDSLNAIELLFKTDMEPTRVAAIVIEPVQGEGGFYIAPFELLVANCARSATSTVFC